MKSPFLYWAAVHVVIGLWLCIGLFLLGFSDRGPAMWNNVILGALLVFLTVVASSYGGFWGEPIPPDAGQKKERMTLP